MQQTPKKKPIDKIVLPVQRFIQQEKSSGLVLGISVLIAIFLANSQFSDIYHHVLDEKFGFQWQSKTYFNLTIHHWINDGLMAIFFFLVGLELKREIIGGELSNPKKASLPIVAALGGMVMPAVIYLLFNMSGQPHKGWGIPMATDIAFALGVLYLLGKKIPFSLKVFLTALAIVDDLGAVLVIAFFYTSNIELNYLLFGFMFLAILYIGNKLGIRSVLFYAIIGVCGVWTTFVISGVHATIAAVLVAFTIPADVKIKENLFIAKIQKYLDNFRKVDPDESKPTLTYDQMHILEKINEATLLATPPLQRIENALYPFVTFIIIPVFALANAGVSLDIDVNKLFENNIAIGVAAGLLLGKVIGVMGFSWLATKINIAEFPPEMTLRRLLGLGLLASIGFTMSLFITSLAFVDPDFQTQAKIGIFAASLVGGILGYMVLNEKEKIAENE